jgi:hypothetical protein
MLTQKFVNFYRVSFSAIFDIEDGSDMGLYLSQIVLSPAQKWVQCDNIFQFFGKLFLESSFSERKKVSGSHHSVAI